MTSSESIPLKACFYHRALLTEKWNRWYLVNPRDVYLHPISFKNLPKSFTQLLCTIWVLLLITRDYVPFFITIAEKHCGVTSQLRPEHLTAYPDGFKRKKEKKKKGQRGSNDNKIIFWGIICDTWSGTSEANCSFYWNRKIRRGSSHFSRLD